MPDIWLAGMKRKPFYCELDSEDAAKINRWAKKGKMPKREVISLALSRLAHTPAFAKTDIQFTMSSGGGVAAESHGQFKRTVASG
jgi:hypothetical protein